MLEFAKPRMSEVPKVVPFVNEDHPLVPLARANRAFSERELKIVLQSVWLEAHQGTQH